MNGEEKVVAVKKDHIGSNSSLFKLATAYHIGMAGRDETLSPSLDPILPVISAIALPKPLVQSGNFK